MMTMINHDFIVFSLLFLYVFHFCSVRANSVPVLVSFVFSLQQQLFRCVPCVQMCICVRCFRVYFSSCCNKSLCLSAFVREWCCITLVHCVLCYWFLLLCWDDVRFRLCLFVCFIYQCNTSFRTHYGWFFLIYRVASFNNIHSLLAHTLTHDINEQSDRCTQSEKGGAGREIVKKKKVSEWEREDCRRCHKMW